MTIETVVLAALVVALAVVVIVQSRSERSHQDPFNMALIQRVLTMEGQVDVLKGSMARATVPGEADSIMRAMLDAAPDAMLLVNTHGVIELANKRAEQMFRWPTSSMTGLPLDELIPERFREAHKGHRANYQNQPRSRPMGVDLDLFGRRSDGSEFPVEIGLSPYQRIGEDKKVVASVRDMTERHKQQHV